MLYAGGGGALGRRVSAKISKLIPQPQPRYLSWRAWHRIKFHIYLIPHAAAPSRRDLDRKQHHILLPAPVQPPCLLSSPAAVASALCVFILEKKKKKRIEEGRRITCTYWGAGARSVASLASPQEKVRWGSFGFFFCVLTGSLGGPLERPKRLGAQIRPEPQKKSDVFFIESGLSTEYRHMSKRDWKKKTAWNKYKNRHLMIRHSQVFLGKLLWLLLDSKVYRLVCKEIHYENTTRQRRSWWPNKNTECLTPMSFFWDELLCPWSPHKLTQIHFGKKKRDLRRIEKERFGREKAE